MMATREQQKVTMYAGECHSHTPTFTADQIELHLDADNNKHSSRICVGDSVSGRLRIVNSTRRTHRQRQVVRVIVEAYESTVVAFPQSSSSNCSRNNHNHSHNHNSMGKEYLEKYTTETNAFFREEVLVDCTEVPQQQRRRTSVINTFNSAAPNYFRFRLSLMNKEKNLSSGESLSLLPSSMKCLLAGTDPILPSQCQVHYVLSASLVTDNETRPQLTRPITVYPPRHGSHHNNQRSSDNSVPSPFFDSSIGVRVGSKMELVWQYLFSCTTRDTTLPTSEQEDEDDDDRTVATEGTASIKSSQSKKRKHRSNKHIPLSLNRTTPLCLAAGQILQVDVQDSWFLAVLQQQQQRNQTRTRNGSSSTNTTWMIRLTETLKWSAQGRTTSTVETWDLIANHHELPMELRRSSISSTTSTDSRYEITPDGIDHRSSSSDKNATIKDSDHRNDRRLIRISHALQIYLKVGSSSTTSCCSKDNKKPVQSTGSGGNNKTSSKAVWKEEIVALSESIPVHIVSHQYQGCWKS